MIMQIKSNNLSLRQLRSFMAVAQNRSFVAAAKALFISQSALSGTIRQLEEDVGIRLLDRTTRSVELTAAGEEFHADVADLLARLDVTVKRMSDLGSARRGLVRVTGVASVLSMLTAPCIARLMAVNSGIAFEIVEDGTSNVISAVLAGTADFAIGAMPESVPDGLRTTPLLQDRYVVMASKDHEIFKLRQLSPEAVRAFTYLSIPFGGGLTEDLDASLDPRVRVNNFGALIPLLEAGAGVSILPYLAAEREKTPQLAFKAFSDPRYVRRVSLVRRQARSLSPAAQLLWDEMIACAPRLLSRRTTPGAARLLTILPNRKGT